MHPRRLVCLPLALLALIHAPACKRAAPAALTPGAATGPIDRSRPLPDPLPAIAARVNGEPIPTTKVAALARQREDRGNRTDGPNAGVLRETLQRVVQRELLFQEALQRGLSTDARALERAYDQLRATEPDPERWRQRLVREGATSDDLKRELRIQATVAQLVNSLPHRLPSQIEDDEARAYLMAHPDLGHVPRRWQVGQILLKADPDATPEDRQILLARGQALRARLKEGASFETLLREMSADPKAGDPLELLQGSLEPAFERALDALRPGQVSDVLISPLGAHIVKLQQTFPAADLPYEALREQVRNAMVNAEKQRAVDELLRQLEARARIEVFL
jgi:parvulin-like peptidyl-prolyl isomerase